MLKIEKSNTYRPKHMMTPLLILYKLFRNFRLAFRNNKTNLSRTNAALKCLAAKRPWSWYFVALA